MPAERTRSLLRRRDDVPDEQVDEVIERAQALQDAELHEAEGATLDELVAVAEELEIEPRFVEQALAQLRGEEEAALRQAELDAAEAEARKGRLRRGLAAALVAVLALGTGVAGLGMKGAAQLSASTAALQEAEVAVELVLDRQATLVPQLVAVSGGDVDALAEALDALRAAQDLEARLAASQALGQAAAEALAAAPDSTSKTETLYELTGTQNRISTELRRYEEARSVWETEAARPLPSLAVALGI